MKKSNKMLWYLLSAVALLIIVAFVGKKQGWIGGKDEVEVSVEPVSKLTIVETVSASGKIQPEVEVKLSPEVSGELVEIYVKEGDRVKKGQLLCKIRPDFYASDYSRSEAMVNEVKANMANSQAQLASAEATFKNAEASYNRNQKLFQDKVISQSEYDAALAQYEQAKQSVSAAKQSVQAARYNVASTQASLEQSGVNLAKTTIYSPIDGIVSLLSVKKGERVLGTAQMQGTEIMRIADLKSMEAVVDVNENDINRISLNDTADIEVDAFLGKKFKGVVTSIANSASTASSTATTDQVTNFQVKVHLIPSSYEQLLKGSAESPFRPGLSSTVDVHTEKSTNALSVPIQSVTTREPEKKDDKDKGPQSKEDDKKADKSMDQVQPLVFVMRNGVAQSVNVTTGIQNDSFIEIKSGLKAGDQVITGPYLAVSKTLKSGDKVKKVEKDKLYAGEKKK
ncbi:efflux RND transporter periplasmic adaptor subunit [Solitalea sp. MAHUQ-68]|uniref:Efflux RND transporter periplasmic adaptor subunit n=1 Tax=Solitalea agri TaxID=2953739 RepID=A0A9X2F0J0_9SPHI|nr:efflux RND transporter periplasmic adaptor subunit [Solitalea agri]MCO4291830.1 efflux RND transporter periplasmic adaptor subunit [Solitalea agri]